MSPTFYKSFRSVIKNKVPVTEYNDPVDCDFNTTIVLTSTATQEGTYWVIAAHVDCRNWNDVSVLIFSHHVPSDR